MPFAVRCRGLMVLCLALMPVLAAPALCAPIERIEPPHWWTGFRNPSLQLMIHGDDAAGLRASINDPRVTLADQTALDSPNYLFLTLTIAPDAAPGPLEITFSREGRTIETVTYGLRARPPGSAERKGFDASDVIYLVTPDRFANGDPANDTVEGYTDGFNREDDYGRHGGDLQGLIDRLDYMAGMGFTSLWINPVLENAQPKDSYHGYATTDFYKVDPRYGSHALYRKLSEEARARGIGLIMDMIANHSGDRHWWMEDLPAKDWISNGGTYVNTNHLRTTHQDPYAAPSERALMEEGWFVRSMPDLDQDNPYLATYLVQNAIWWIEEAGLHGIRMDTWPYPDADFMARWTADIMREYPNFSIVGEEWSVNPTVVSYWLEGRDNPNGYVSMLNSAMDFPLNHAIRRALTEPEAWDTGFMVLYESMVNDTLYPDPGRLVIFLDNHDMDRALTQYGGDLDLLKMGLTWLATMRGIPQIYYGTEVLLANETPHDHGEIREDMPGGWPDDTANAFTGAGLSADQRAMQDYLRTLLTWRKDTPALHSGRMMHFSPRDGVYTFVRYDDDAMVLVALNKASEPRRLDATRFDDVLNGRRRARDPLTGKTHDLTNGIMVPARSPLVLEVTE